tara:strand:- start:645 stop:761 length:117 start_codon:yes stop_codon:yes gene_type:complete
MSDITTEVKILMGGCSIENCWAKATNNNLCKSHQQENA